MLNFIKRLLGLRPKWIDIPDLDPFSANNPGDHGTHHIEFVSRHSIAETGLICPCCENEVAPLGDYRLVRHCRLGDVIRCNGTRQMGDGTNPPCPMYLVASPDTEHGDHLVYDAVPPQDRLEKFCRFVRISKADTIKRRYGGDAKMVKGELVASVKKADAPAPPNTKPKLGLKKDQLWQTNDDRQFVILRVQENGDPVYDGWGWGNFLNEPAFEWNVDPFGLIRQSMRDPTQSDRSRLVSEIRPL